MSIPLSSIRTLSRGSRFTLAARLVLAVLLVGGLAAVFLLSHRRQHDESLLGSGTSPVIALDVSWSVGYDRSKLIEQTLKSFVDAQRRMYRLRPEPLQEVDEWLAPFRRFWSARVDALERHLDRLEQSSRAKGKTRRAAG